MATGIAQEVTVFIVCTLWHSFMDPLFTHQQKENKKGFLEEMVLEKENMNKMSSNNSANLEKNKLLEGYWQLVYRIGRKTDPGGRQEIRPYLF